MDKKEIKKRKRRRNRLIKSFVLVVAFVIAIGATFGVTMAYFGGKSTTANYDMVLKMGLYVGTPTQATNEVYAYVVPSQVVTAKCEFTVKSSKNATGTDSDPVSDVTASNGLIRAKIEFSGIEGVTLDNGTASQVFFPVYLDDDDETIVANFVKRAKVSTQADAADDGYYYLVKENVLTSNDANMYPVETSSGEKKFNFELRVSVPKNLTNTHAGQKITLNVTYEVIQADFFENGSTNPTDKTIANAYGIFEEVKNNNASYTYGTAQGTE